MAILILIIKGHNSVNIARGVTVLVLCISSDHGLHLYQACTFERFMSYGADTICDGQTDRHTDGQTDSQTFMRKTVCLGGGIIILRKKTLQKLWFLFSTRRLMLLYICTTGA